MAWKGPPTTKEELEHSLDEIRVIAGLLSYDQMIDIYLIIGKLRSQIDHIPWKEEADA